MNDGHLRWVRYGGVAAWSLFLAAAVIAGLRLDGYSHRLHPLALLGAEGVPGATAFNIFAFIVPGGLAAWSMWRLRSSLRMPVAWRDRIAAQCLLLSALAFAAQGVFPLDADDPAAHANDLHALAWTLWWLAFAVAGLLGLAKPALRREGRVIAVVAVVVLALALVRWPGALGALAPRVAMLVWLVWIAWRDLRQHREIG